MELKPRELLLVLRSNQKHNNQPELRRADIQLLPRVLELDLKICILQSDWQRIAFSSVNQMDSTIDFITEDDKWMITKETNKWHLVVNTSDRGWRDIATNQSPKILMEKLEYILS